MSRFRILSLLLLILLSSSFTGCARREAVDEAPELEVILEVVPAPASTGPSTLLIQISKGPQGEVGEFLIDVRGDMSHAGMTPVIVTGARGESGSYAIPFEWTMAGDWYITITATLPDGRRLLRTLPIQVRP